MRLRMGTKIGLHRQVEFLTLVVTWFIFGCFFTNFRLDQPLLAVWAFLAGVVSMMGLSAIGFFDHHIPKPEMNAIVSLLVILPISGLIGKWLMMLTSVIPPVRYTETMKAAACVAVFFELAQAAIFKLHRMTGRKWCLTTYLEPEELKVLRAQIEESGVAWWITIDPHPAGSPNGQRLRGDETVVISRKAVRHLKDHPELLSAHLNGHRIVDVRQLLKEFRGRVDLHHADAWTFLLGTTYQSFTHRFYFYVKEISEVLLAIVLLWLLSPFIIGLGLGLLVTGGRPVFYRQKRLGYRGKEFWLYKFRTMPLTAETDGPQWAQEDDPRVTRFGRWLRKTRLDELPQLMNVIRGDLSFVGPRPERPEFYKVLNEHIPLFSSRLLVRPGITGWAQVRQGYASSIEESRMKLEYDLYYVQNMSPSLDLQVIVHTVAMMFRGTSGR